MLRITGPLDRPRELVAYVEIVLEEVAAEQRAARDGPGDLDPAHVLGRIAWVESLNPARGARFAAIRW